MRSPPGRIRFVHLLVVEELDDPLQDRDNGCPLRATPLRRLRSL